MQIGAERRFFCECATKRLSHRVAMQACERLASLARISNALAARQLPPGNAWYDEHRREQCCQCAECEDATFRHGGHGILQKAGNTCDEQRPLLSHARDGHAKWGRLNPFSNLREAACERFA